MKNKSQKSVIILSRFGCLIPVLMVLNLSFGWIFFKVWAWLAIEAGLLFLFIINSFVLFRRVFREGKGGDFIDVEEGRG